LSGEAGIRPLTAGCNQDLLEKQLYNITEVSGDFILPSGASCSSWHWMSLRFSRLPVQFSLAGTTWTYDFEAPPAPLVLPRAYRVRYEQQIDLGRRVRRQLGFVP